MIGTGQWSAAYLDVVQGVGITESGRRFTCRPDARLGEVVAVVPAGVRRLYLCGQLPHLHGVVAGDDHTGGAVRAADAATGDDVGDEDDAGDSWDDPDLVDGVPSGYLQWCWDDPAAVSPGWQEDPDHAHHRDPSPSASNVLHVRHALDGRRLDVCSLRSWVGAALAASCTPDEARDAFAWLTRRIACAFDGAALLGSAGQTGLHTWRHCAERSGTKDCRPLLERYPVLPEDLRALLHHTSGQARIERFLPTAPGSAALLPRLSYYDGRLMYVASMAGLGVGPVTHDAQPTFVPYRPAWYRVRFTVPPGWCHPGVLPMQVAGTRRVWEWPTEPGDRGETWASDHEVVLACWPFPHACPTCAAGYRSGGLPCPTHGWGVQIHERLLFTPGEKPLDTWKDKLFALRAEAERDLAAGPLSVQGGALVTAALRNLLVNGLGSFHRARHTVTQHARQGETDRIPPSARGLHPLPDGSYHWTESYQQPVDLFTHPEWSVQVWGRSRARMLLAHYAAGSSVWTGMLALSPGSVVACKTDGLYLATDPHWPDDGRPGRLRLKGQLLGPIPWPQDWPALASLKQRLDAQLERDTVETDAIKADAIEKEQHA